MSQDTATAAGVNPWLRAAPGRDEEAGDKAAVAEKDVALGERVAALGPARPLHLPEGAAAAGEPDTGGSEDLELVVVGLHGGAGASLVAGLLAQRAGEGAGVVKGPRWAPGELLGAGPAVAVTRTHARGLAALHEFAMAWSAGSVVAGSGESVLGVVVVDDGPRLPKPMVTELKRVTGMLPKTWRIPWVESWRVEASHDPAGKVPMRVRLTVNDIHKTRRRYDDARKGEGQ